MRTYGIGALYGGVLRAVRAAFPGAAVHEALPADGLPGGALCCGLYDAEVALQTGGRVRTQAVFEVFYAPAQDGPSCAEAADTLLEALAQIELENGVRVRGGALEAGRAEKAPLRAAARYAAAFSPADTAPKMQAAETGLEVKA